MPTKSYAVGDLDNDGDRDMAVSSTGLTPAGWWTEVELRVVLNKGVEGFSTFVLDDGSGDGSLTMADVDVDGDMDIIFRGQARTRSNSHATGDRAVPEQGGHRS